MQKALKLDGQMRALAISLGGAAVMAVIAMLIPVSIFETITGATGISEIVPATAAPLGDRARAIIAFLFAAGTFAVLAALLLRQPTQRPVARTSAPIVGTQPAAEPKASLVESLREKFSAFVASRRNGPVVTELSDLPKLRAVDAHPDAPPRRPISAHSEFGEIDTGAALPLSNVEMAEAPAPEVAPVIAVAPALIEPKVTEPVPAEDEPEAVQPVEVVATSEIVAATAGVDSVSALVDRLEAALAQRQDQLARLEALAVSQVQKCDVATASPPPLEVVPAEARPDDEADDMDDALRSALATLQRMNTRSR